MYQLGQRLMAEFRYISDSSGCSLMYNSFPLSRSRITSRSTNSSSSPSPGTKHGSDKWAASLVLTSLMVQRWRRDARGVGVNCGRDAESDLSNSYEIGGRC